MRVSTVIPSSAAVVAMVALLPADFLVGAAPRAQGHPYSCRPAVASTASAVALTERVSGDLAYRNGVAIVTMAEGGLMYEASVGGQKLSFHPIAKGA